MQKGNKISIPNREWGDDTTNVLKFFIFFQVMNKFCPFKNY